MDNNQRYPSCIMATCCIPWDDEGRFAAAIFRRGVRATLTRGTKHLYVFGTAGEGYAVTDGQFDQVVAAFADEMRLGNAEFPLRLLRPYVGASDEEFQAFVRLLGERLPEWVPSQTAMGG